MSPLASTLWVALGSLIGGVGRYWLGVAVASLYAPRLPWSTLMINVLGSCLIGVVAASADRDAMIVRLFWMVGVCGGFTTFSAFSLQTVELLQAGETGWAAGYIAGSVSLCLVATMMGMSLGRGLANGG